MVGAVGYAVFGAAAVMGVSREEGLLRHQHKSVVLRIVVAFSSFLFRVSALQVLV